METTVEVLPQDSHGLLPVSPPGTPECRKEKGLGKERADSARCPRRAGRGNVKERPIPGL